MQARRSTNVSTLLNVGISVGASAEFSIAASDCWSSFLLIRKHRIESQDFVLTSWFIRVLIEFLIVSCKALSWREEPSIGVWSIIFSMAANTSIFPFSEKAVSVKTFLASPRSELCRICSFRQAEYGLLCTNSTKRSWNRIQSRYSPLNSGMLIGGRFKFRLIGASFSRSRFISYSSYNCGIELALLLPGLF